MSAEAHINDLKAAIAKAVSKERPWMVWTGHVAMLLRSCVNAQRDIGIVIDQHQSNGLYAVHQMRVRQANDPNVYRLILAPIDTPITIGECIADQHFLKPLNDGLGR
jgi:hypothetical protein